MIYPIEASIVVSVENLDAPHFGEIAERIAIGQQLLYIHLVFQTLYDIDHVVDHVFAHHQVHELAQRTHALSRNILEFVRQFLFQARTQN